MRRLNHVIVVGAGPSGLITKLMLQNQGITSTLLERVERDELVSDVGGGYDLSANTLKIFRNLNIYDAIEAKSAKFDAISFYKSNGGISRTMHFPSSSIEPLSILRSNIQKVLLDQVSSADPNLSNIHCGAKVTDFVSEPNGTVTVETERGEQFSGDLLIGADGIWSKIRSKLTAEKQISNDANFCECHCFWGRVNFDELSDDKSEVKDEMKRFLLENLPKNEYFMSMQKGQSVMGGMMQSNIFMWCAMQKTQIPIETNAGMERKKYVSDTFKPFHNEIVSRLIECTDAADFLETGIFDRDEIDSWSANENTVLIGDAAHPMTPFLGMGCNSAICDAFVLCKYLEEQPGVGAAIKRYEERRMKPVYSKLVKPARSLCDWSMSENMFVSVAMQKMFQWIPTSIMVKELIKSDEINDVSDFL